MSWRAGVFHNPSGVYHEVLGPVVKLRVRVPLEAPVEQLYLRCAPDGEQLMMAAQPLAGPPDHHLGWNCRWWEVPLSISNPKFHYRFYLLTSAGGWWYNAFGMTRHLPTDHYDFQILTERHSPGWLDQAVFYQIFPDRFADGDPSNNVQSGGHKVDGQPAVARNWGELPNVHQGGREFFGGDLQGITQHLDHIQDTLGINALYLNPIGTAPSSHKYDVASYTEVDPHLGGEKAFVELRRALSERSMRIILDIVPNHCGSAHPWFQAALKDPEAETAEFFKFSNHPHDYDCWLGVRSLPKLNYASPRLREVMYSGPDSIMRKWLKPPLSIDGWRIDVANMLARHGASQLGHKILRGMRRAVKAENPDCYFLGENFFDASSNLQGDELDATMNYRGFMMPLLHWLTGQDYEAVFGRTYADRHPLATTDLEVQLRSFRATVPWSIARHQFNLLNSHDTPRLLNLVGGDRQRAAVARLLLFTYPGIPCVYYGDEIGLEGGRDPDNRRTMNWDSTTWDRAWLGEWAQLIRFRTGSEALCQGCLQVLCSQESTLAFLRETPKERVLVVARRAPDGVDRLSLVEAAIPDRARFRELFSGQTARVEGGFLAIPPAQVQIWRQI